MHIPLPKPLMATGSMMKRGPNFPTWKRLGKRLSGRLHR
jgi:hypothetical protein